ncbi:hypothetical protein Patl1_34127 [Pistacia atlantica]|uniref:Uncharacterized protein n=1 Tax=Pistacia atlantica TaxID=434234 RepID=A0ACC0ZWF0_9ROSI|nr:hypothetical protein Patl1_34127 [Pistacia atlantica]
MSHVSDIKLIRTDTTLDLSQKAEKGMLCPLAQLFFYSSTLHCLFCCLINVGETRPTLMPLFMPIHTCFFFFIVLLG